MDRFAQTHLQLYGELVDAGYEEAALTCVRDAYELASELFAGDFRATGKPFVCHLVGTASILLRERPPAEALAAALLHAAYRDWISPTGGTGVMTRLQCRLRAVSAGGEELVLRYAEMPVGDSELRAQCDAVDDTSAGRSLRWLLLVQVANGLEDHLDAASEACEKPTFDLELLGDLARRLDAPSLAALADALREAERRQRLPRVLRQSRVRSYALRPPLPWNLRAARVFRALARRLRSRRARTDESEVDTTPFDANDL